MIQEEAFCFVLFCVWYRILPIFPGPNYPYIPDCRERILRGLYAATAVYLTRLYRYLMGGGIFLSS
ncbi:unnamed protein product, partial [Laminaria digitata]